MAALKLTQVSLLYIAISNAGIPQVLLALQHKAFHIHHKEECRKQEEEEQEGTLYIWSISRYTKFYIETWSRRDFSRPQCHSFLDFIMKHAISYGFLKAAEIKKLQKALSFHFYFPILCFYHSQLWRNRLRNQMLKKTSSLFFLFFSFLNLMLFKVALWFWRPGQKSPRSKDADSFTQCQGLID